MKRMVARSVLAGLMISFGVLAADDPERLFLTRLRPFVLQPSTNRPDHKEFFIQIFTSGRIYSFTKTNSLLTIHDLEHIPDGPAFLVVQSVCLDGDKSPEIPFSIDLRKSPPDAPLIKPLTVSEEEASARTMEDLRLTRNRDVALKFPWLATPAPANRPCVPGLRRRE
jgi:hypothetical protein